VVLFATDFFSGASPTDIAASEADPRDVWKLLKNLSPTRRNGLTGGSPTHPHPRGSPAGTLAAVSRLPDAFSTPTTILRRPRWLRTSRPPSPTTRKPRITHAVVNGTEESDWPTVAALCSSRSSKTRFQPRGQAYFQATASILGIQAIARPVGLDQLRTDLDADPRAAVGEIWARPLDAPPRAPRRSPCLAGLRRAPLEEQLEIFKTQLALAVDLDRPATIHCIDAFGLLLETLRSVSLPPRGLCFTPTVAPLSWSRPSPRSALIFRFQRPPIRSPRHARLRAVFQAVPLEASPNREPDAPAMLAPVDFTPYSLSRRSCIEPPRQPCRGLRASGRAARPATGELTARIAADPQRPLPGC